MWEYTSVSIAATGFWVGGNLDMVQFQSMLNEHGKQGWELVSSFDTNQASGATRNVIVVFKRPAS
jgi:Domain of unknown function (DUF4177)